MGIAIEKFPDEDVVLYLDVKTVQEGLIAQPAGFPKIRISHSIDGSTVIEDVAPVQMNSDPGRVGEFLYKFAIPDGTVGIQFKAQYQASIDGRYYYDFDVINIVSPTQGADCAPSVRFN